MHMPDSPFAIPGRPFPGKDETHLTADDYAGFCRWMRNGPQARIMRMLVSLSEGKECVAQNGKFDNMWLKTYYDIKFHLDFDTGLAHHILDENSPHDLKYMSRMFLDVEDYDITTEEKKGNIAPMKLYEYGAKDAMYTLRLGKLFKSRLRKDKDLYRLFYKLTMPGARVMENIELRGIPMDLKDFEQIAIETRAAHTQSLIDLNSMANSKRPKAVPGIPRKNVNWNSPQQVAELFYQVLKLPCTVKTDGGAQSTGEAALADLKGKHKIVDQLILYRELEKFLSTYLDGWKPFIVDGRLFLGYKLHGTVTGRFSSRLHQIPRDGRIRNIACGYTDLEGNVWEFVQGDVSQAELRIAAHLSGDIELITAYRRNVDVHWATLLYMIGTNSVDMYNDQAMDTARKLAGREPRSLTDAVEIMREAGHEKCIALWPDWKDGRKKAKAVNFGFIYGMYENKFIETAKLKYGWEPTWEEAHAIREAYFGLYRGLPIWHKRVKKLVTLNEYVISLSGRKRRLPGAASPDRGIRSEAERQAVNSPVQGFIGDYKAMAMIEIEETISHDDLVIIGEHHDALLMLVRSDRKSKVLPKVNSIMRNPALLKTFGIELDVPMESDLDVGNWGRGKTWKLEKSN
jgi:DNA polymerase-1